MLLFATVSHFGCWSLIFWTECSAYMQSQLKNWATSSFDIILEWASTTLLVAVLVFRAAQDADILLKAHIKTKNIKTVAGTACGAKNQY